MSEPSILELFDNAVRGRRREDIVERRITIGFKVLDLK